MVFELEKDATNLTRAQARQAVGAIGGGRATSFASLRRFCAIAASVNSNWAARGPRNRRRPSRRMRFKCANSISTRFLSRHDCSNALVLTNARATARASSSLRINRNWTARALPLHPLDRADEAVAVGLDWPTLTPYIT